MSSKTVQLSYPVEAHGKTINEITLRRPKGADLRAVDGMDKWAETVTLISRLGSIPPSSANEMDAVDVVACGVVIADFLRPSPPTGGSE